MNLSFDIKGLHLWSLTIVWLLNAFCCQLTDGWENVKTDVKFENDKCRTNTGLPGICKKIDQCEALLNKQAKYEFLGRCTFDNLIEVVCCPSNKNSGIVQSKKPAKPRKPIGRPSVAACKKYKNKNPSNFGPNTLHDEPVSLDFPHMGRLIYNQSHGKEVRPCGSSLISNRYVLTAAHCVWDSSFQPIKVRFGAIELNPGLNSSQLVDFEIESVILHPSYTYPAYYHDIALLKLATKVNFNRHISPACLHSDTRDLPSTTELTVIGWGETNVKTRQVSDILLKTNVFTYPLDTCYSYLFKNKPLNESLIDGQYCAYGKDKGSDACTGSSGGSLQIGIGAPTEVVGILSYGLSCGTSPSVYTRVASYLDWIESIVWDTSDFTSKENLKKLQHSKKKAKSQRKETNFSILIK